MDKLKLKKKSQWRWKNFFVGVVTGIMLILLGSCFGNLLVRATFQWNLWRADVLCLHFFIPLENKSWLRKTEGFWRSQNPFFCCNYFIFRYNNWDFLKISFYRNSHNFGYKVKLSKRLISIRLFSNLTFRSKYENFN